MKKSFLIVVLAVVAGCGIKSQLKKLPIVSGYSAKQLCSYTFISERSQNSIEKEDLAMFPLSLTTSDINYENKSVTSTVLGLGKKTAVYKENLGCVLLYDDDNYNIRFKSKTPNTEQLTSFPYGENTPDKKPSGVDYEKLERAVDDMFDLGDEISDKKTRAILVIYKDTIVAEKYAKDIDQNTELLGWSMTKSIMNAWVGMMIQDGKISLNDNNLFDSWVGDDRKAITLDDLMHMSSGLRWEEVYDKVSGATTMLFDSEDIVKTASAPDLAHPVGEHWQYSSGSSNLISGYLRKQYDSHIDYLKYPYERIFYKLNMFNTTIESDEAGNYIGSSYCYATARDWGRFGLLYLHDGIWNKERLLPEGWVDYSTNEVTDSHGVYGAQFWLNKRGSAYPDAPYDLFSANGYQGQRIFIIPSKDLVIVRLGLNEELQFNTFLKQITESINE